MRRTWQVIPAKAKLALPKMFNQAREIGRGMILAEINIVFRRSCIAPLVVVKSIVVLQKSWRSVLAEISENPSSAHIFRG